MSKPDTDKAKAGGIKIVTDNRKAGYNYSLEDRFEAGIVLTGTEVKALRQGLANLQDSYAVFKNDELFLINCHITEYKHGNLQNHAPTRTRKLLLNRSELDKLWTKTETRGYSLVPTKIYFKNGRAKLEIALGRGKKTIDKRQTTKDREMKRELERVKRRER